MSRASIPFAAQDLMSAGVARVDALILSALATQEIVGYYGAAYRLLEATLFLSVALQGAFAAMYTYLSERTEPSIHAFVQRSLKLSLALLTPCAVALGMLSEPILELLYGGFDTAVTPLRLLGLTVVPLGIAMLMWVLITSRREPRVLVIYSAVTLAVNVALNLVLIPPLEAIGAALAMLLTYVVAAAMMLRLAIQTVGRLDARQTLGAPGGRRSGDGGRGLLPRAVAVRRPTRLRGRLPCGVRGGRAQARTGGLRLPAHAPGAPHPLATYGAMIAFHAPVAELVDAQG
jgi:O-antigen/teichoic acid export membrane protein